MSRIRLILETLENLVDLARLSASGGNRQPLKYLIYNTPEECEKIFPYPCMGRLSYGMART